MASRCTDGDYTTRDTCEAASSENVWCTDSMPVTAEGDGLDDWLRCLDFSGVTDAVELVVAVAVLVALLFTGTALVQRIIRTAGERS